MVLLYKSFNCFIPRTARTGKLPSVVTIPVLFVSEEKTWWDRGGGRQNISHDPECTYAFGEYEANKA